jgi:tripartite-type tricarboxylate transporter receptor subunit TctC
VSSDKRLKSLPEVPTLAEAGFPHIDLRGWVGLVGPAGLPANIVSAMHSAVASALEAPAVQARLETTGAMAAPSSPEAFAAFIAREAQRWQKVVVDAQIKFD